LSVDLILARLDSPRRSGRGWLAKCPAHRDRSPSLSVAEGDGGRVLMHCFTGCDVTDVLAAIGLTLADLFPERARDLSPLERQERRQAAQEADWRAALNVLAREADVVGIAASFASCGLALPDDDRQRLRVAIERIHDARAVLA
jgi:DNA primase